MRRSDDKIFVSCQTPIDRNMKNMHFEATPFEEFLDIQANYRLWIHSETRTWHDNNIQSYILNIRQKTPYIFKAFSLYNFFFLFRQELKIRLTDFVFFYFFVDVQVSSLQ